jgi:vacuolar-type H+-ATPase subunit H
MELQQLIATEQRLDDALRRAREECARLVADAREAARRAEAALAAEIEATAEATAVATATERQRREAEIARDAAERVARYDAVPASRIQELAQDVVTRLVSQGAT